MFRITPKFHQYRDKYLALARKATVVSIVLMAAFAAITAAAPADERKPGLYWTFETDKGKIACKLFEAEAPVTVRTMVGLAMEGLLRASGDQADRAKEILRRPRL